MTVAHHDPIDRRHDRLGGTVVGQDGAMRVDHEQRERQPIQSDLSDACGVRPPGEAIVEARRTRKVRLKPLQGGEIVIPEGALSLIAVQIEEGRRIGFVEQAGCGDEVRAPRGEIVLNAVAADAGTVDMFMAPPPAG